MEIRPTPDQEALIRAAIEAGRFDSAEDAVMEALALWEERERAAVLRELRASLDEAEASIERGEGIEITPKSMHRLTKDVMARCRARLKAEQKTSP
jgi:Arc/MetJ-type ribon-helix-helix transcriptional regulator